MQDGQSHGRSEGNVPHVTKGWGRGENWARTFGYETREFGDPAYGTDNPATRTERAMESEGRVRELGRGGYSPRLCVVHRHVVRLRTEMICAP